MALPDDQPWKLNNTALKSIRFSNEDCPGCPRRDMPKWGVSLFSSDTVQVHTLQRGDKTDYELVEPFQPWSWKKMFRSFDEDTRNKIIGDGITDICFGPLWDSYDHKRHNAWNDAYKRGTGENIPEDVKSPIWDFQVWRKDGSGVRFHPGQTKRKFEVSDCYSKFETEGPSAGRGNSDGPGTYRRMIRRSYDEPKGGGFANAAPPAAVAAAGSAADGQVVDQAAVAAAGSAAAPPRSDNSGASSSAAAPPQEATTMPPPPLAGPPPPRGPHIASNSTPPPPPAVSLSNPPPAPLSNPPPAPPPANMPDRPQRQVPLPAPPPGYFGPVPTPQSPPGPFVPVADGRPNVVPDPAAVAAASQMPDLQALNIESASETESQNIPHSSVDEAPLVPPSNTSSPSSWEAIDLEAMG